MESDDTSGSLVMRDNSNASNGRVGKVMRYLLFLLLAGLASVEYFHHLADGHTLDEISCTTPQAKLEGARDMLRQHLHNH